MRMSAWTDEPLDDREFPDEEDLHDEDDPVLGRIVPCPHCGCGIYDDAPRCPQCGHWISQSTGRWRSSRKWYVRSGLWLSRVLLTNWLFWIALSAIAAATWWIKQR